MGFYFIQFSNRVTEVDLESDLASLSSVMWYKQQGSNAVLKFEIKNNAVTTGIKKRQVKLNNQAINRTEYLF